MPGQGAPLHDKTYLKLTADLFAAIIAQVHQALEHGQVTMAQVQAAVNVDSFGNRFTPGAGTGQFKQLVTALVKKVYQESLDGIGR